MAGWHRFLNRCAVATGGFVSVRFPESRIFGRKHADAPYHDGSPIWGDFDAQDIFENLKGDLRIHPVRVGFAAYYESMGRVDLMENHPDEKPVFISGKEVRRTLLEGKSVDPRIMRESTSKILAEAMAAVVLHLSQQAGPRSPLVSSIDPRGIRDSTTSSGRAAGRPTFASGDAHRLKPFVRCSSSRVASCLT